MYTPTLVRHVMVRADASSTIGIGHMMRTIAVADEFASVGVKVTFLSKELPSFIANLLKQRGHFLQGLDLAATATEVEDASATVSQAASFEADVIILDNYDLRTEWTRHVSSNCHLPIAAIHDLADSALSVSLLIDPSPFRVESDYAELLPISATCLTGTDYAPVRREFALARTASIGGREFTGNFPLRVAISMGGSDPQGLTLTTLDALDQLQGVEVTIYISKISSHLANIKHRVSRMSIPARLVQNCDNMAQQLSGMDIAIGAAGSSSLERCVIGLPSILAVAADNQRFNARQLEQFGAATVLHDFKADSVRRAIEDLINNRGFRQQMAAKAASLCDGLGVTRIAKAITGLISSTNLRPAVASDAEFIFSLQSEPGARQFARNRQVPSLAEHMTWFGKRLEVATNFPFYIVEWSGRAIGFVRLDATDDAHTREVSISISRTVRQKGIGLSALRQLRLTHPQPNLVAAVHPNNAASQRLFRRVGFYQVNASQYRAKGWGVALATPSMDA